MALIYDESSLKTFSNIRISDIDGTKAYLKHFENQLYLSFMAKHGSRDERWQAERELVICERKMRYWEKHPRFIGEDARRGMEALKKNWRI
jgi:hypothetical protein